MTPDNIPRRIRSFVRREGRMTDAQKRAFDGLLPRYGIPPGTGLLDLDALFGRQAPRHLEIGFGNGDNLLHMAQTNPGNDYLGIEVYRTGAGRLLRAVHAQALGNVRIACEDAIEVLQQRLPDNSLAAVLLFFPDPWPKQRHHKRRIVNHDFVTLVTRKLVPGGRFHLATDWESYAEHMLAVLSASAGISNTAGARQFSPRPDYRPLTRFEKRGQHLGHTVRDLIFVRNP